MKKLFFLFIVAVSCAFISCSDRNNPISYGSIQCINNNSDPYYVTINGNTPLKFTQNAKTTITKKVEYGYYTIYVKQASGYLLYPTEKEFNFYVKSGKNSVVSY